MKKKFENAFRALIKDYGLSDKAITALVEQGTALIEDDATEELVTSQANLFANIAKTMQGEVTRKVQEAKNPPKDDSPKDGGKDNQTQTTQGQDSELQKQLTALTKQLADLQKANEDAKAERAEEARQAIVKKAAKKAGLDMEKLHLFNTSQIKTEEEAEKFFSEIKQEMVNNNLRPKDAGGKFATNAEADKADAEAWAKTLKDK